MKSKILISDKNREHPFSHQIQFLCLISFFFIWILDSFIFHLSTSLSTNIPLIMRVTFFLFVLGIAILLLRLSHYVLFSHTREQEGGENHHPDELIETGIMAHVRHPLYLGTLLIYVAFFFLTLSLISFFCWIIIFGIYDRMASFEEKQLELMFCKAYLEYKSCVPKWIPR